MSEHQLATNDDLDLAPPPRTRLLVVVLVVAIHVAAVLGLIKAFAPRFVDDVAETVLSTFNVTITPPPPPPPPPEEPKKSGAAAEIGKKAVPREAASPKPNLPIAKPTAAPPVAGKGPDNAAGASDKGSGTGAGGQGNGTGSGAGGDGQGGGGIATKPSVRSGELNNASDFPVPAGGRQTRFGKRVTVFFTVTADGRARDCSVTQSNVDAEATALVCSLVIRKIRFNPATRADGTPVETRYGYRVDFKER